MPRGRSGTAPSAQRSAPTRSREPARQPARRRPLCAQRRAQRGARCGRRAGRRPPSRRAPARAAAAPRWTAAPRIGGDACRVSRQRRRADRRRPAALLRRTPRFRASGLAPRDALRDKLVHAPQRDVRGRSLPDGEEAQPSVGRGMRQLLVDGLASDIGNRAAALSRLQPQTSVNVIGEHNRRSLHASSITHHAYRSRTPTTLDEPAANG